MVRGSTCLLVVSDVPVNAEEIAVRANGDDVKVKVLLFHELGEDVRRTQGVRVGRNKHLDGRPGRQSLYRFKGLTEALSLDQHLSDSTQRAQLLGGVSWPLQRGDEDAEARARTLLQEDVRLWCFPFGLCFCFCFFS